MSTDLSLRIDGPEAAPALVLLHPIATTGSVWDLQVAVWAQSCRVLRVDLPGHGQSAPLDAKAATLADYAAAVTATLDRAGVETFALVGASFGGMVAQALALDHRSRVRALVLAHTTARTLPAVKEIWEQRIVQTTAEGMDSQVEPTLARWFTPAYAAAAPLHLRWVGDMIRRTPAAAYIAATRAIQGLDHLDRLGDLRVPSLVIGGKHDTALPFAASQALAEQLGAPLVGLESAHFGNVERPGEFTEAVGAFVAAHPGG